VTIYEKEVAEFVSEEGESFFFGFFFEGGVSLFFERQRRSKFSLAETPATRSSKSRHKLNVTN
jgi:hypothetical protein